MHAAGAFIHSLIANLILMTGFFCRSTDCVQLLLIRCSGQVASLFSQLMLKRFASGEGGGGVLGS